MIVGYINSMSPKIREEFPSVFAKRLEELRKSRQLTQEELAEKIGVTRASIAYYETSAKNPRLETIYKISEFFGVPPEDLITDKPKANGKPGPASKLDQQIGRLKLLPIAKQRMIANMLEAALNSD